MIATAARCLCCVGPHRHGVISRAALEEAQLVSERVRLRRARTDEEPLRFFFFACSRAAGAVREVSRRVPAPTRDSSGMPNFSQRRTIIFRKSSAAVQHLGYACARTKKSRQRRRRETELLESKPDCLDGVRWAPGPCHPHGGCLRHAWTLRLLPTHSIV